MNFIIIALQYILPKVWLTEILGWFANKNRGWLTRVIIILFIRIYKINMQEVAQPNINYYNSFNAFFIRSLQKNARPINKNPFVLVMPADGTLSQFGRIDGINMFYAKGLYYSLDALLAGNQTMIKQFNNGNFSTIYLAPGNYHRVHMPCNGILLDMLYIPGKLFSVNPIMINKIPNLFTYNERIICLFDTNFGLMAQILIGAIIVGSIATVWAGTIVPPRSKIIRRWHYAETHKYNPIILAKGEEMGYFKMGSTVINLFVGNNVCLSKHLYIKHIARVGQCLAYGIQNINYS